MIPIPIWIFVVVGIVCASFCFCKRCRKNPSSNTGLIVGLILALGITVFLFLGLMMHVESPVQVGSQATSIMQAQSSNGTLRMTQSGVPLPPGYPTVSNTQVSSDRSINIRVTSIGGLCLSLLLLYALVNFLTKGQHTPVLRIGTVVLLLGGIAAVFYVFS